MGATQPSPPPPTALPTLSRSLLLSPAPPISVSRLPRSPRLTWPIHPLLRVPLQLLRRLPQLRLPPQPRRAKTSPTLIWASTSLVKRLIQDESRNLPSNSQQKPQQPQQQQHKFLLFSSPSPYDFQYNFFNVN